MRGLGVSPMDTAPVAADIVRVGVDTVQLVAPARVAATVVAVD